MKKRNYTNLTAKLITFMLKAGFTKEEIIAAINAVRILWDYEMIVDILQPKEIEQ
jgi:hypothetical protein